MQLKEVEKKLVLLGDGKVGKTSLITRYLEKNFDKGYVPGTGMKVYSKTMQYSYPNLVVNLNLSIWDTCGQKSYSRIRDAAFEGADGVILVGDLSRPETISSLEEFWFNEVREQLHDSPIALIGNKLDLVTPQSPSAHLLESLAASHGIQVFLTSAKTGENVDEIFRSAGQIFVKEFEGGLPMEKKGRPTNLKEAIDCILDDFVNQHGSMEKALLIAQNQFKLAGVDMERPTRKAVVKAVENLRMVEENTLTSSMAKVNFEERMEIVDSVRD